MADEIELIHPRLVLFSIYVGNDYGDLLRNKLFRLDKSGILVENDQIDLSILRKKSDEKIILFDKKKIENHSALIRLIKSYYWHWNQVSTQEPIELPSNPVEQKAYIQDMLRMSNDEYQTYIVENNNKVKSTGGDHYDADISIEQKSLSAKYKTQLMERVIVQAREATRQIGTTFVVIAIPSPIDVCDGYDVYVDDKEFQSYDREALTGHIEYIAKIHQIPYINLFKCFRDVDDSNSVFRHSGDDHWNERGQDIAAKTVYRYLIDEKLF